MCVYIYIYIYTHIYTHLTLNDSVAVASEPAPAARRWAGISGESNSHKCE